MAIILNAKFGGNVRVNKMYVNAAGRTMIEQARWIHKTLGTRGAAGYLRNRGWSIEASLYVLTGSVREMK